MSKPTRAPPTPGAKPLPAPPGAAAAKPLPSVPGLDASSASAPSLMAQPPQKHLPIPPRSPLRGGPLKPLPSPAAGPRSPAARRQMTGSTKNAGGQKKAQGGGWNVQKRQPSAAARAPMGAYRSQSMQTVTRNSSGARGSRNDERPLPRMPPSHLAGPPPAFNRDTKQPRLLAQSAPVSEADTVVARMLRGEVEEPGDTLEEVQEQLDSQGVTAEELENMALRRRSFKPPPKQEVEEDVVNVDFDDDEDVNSLEEEMDEMDVDPEEDYGVDTLEEAGMVVNWAPAGVPPPVPSRDDPSYQLTEEMALGFVRQKNQVPEDYAHIADDPRLLRLRNKWSPNIFSVKGAKQFAKNKIHPRSLPYVGVLFHAAAAADSATGVGRINKIAKNADSDELKSTFKTMKGTQRTRALQETAYTGVAAALMFLPLIDVVPGLSAQLMVLGTIGAEVAEKGIEMGLKVIISRTTAMVSQVAVNSQEAFGSYGQTKAFLMYLGAPESKDPVYSHWEKARLRLKALYGCAAKDNVFKMKPSGMLLQKLRWEEAKSNKAYTVELPLLVLLFRAFDCWDQLYYDRFIKARQYALTSTQILLGVTVSPDIDTKRRQRDFKRLQDSYKYVEREKPVDPHLHILKPERKKDIIAVLVDAFLHSNRVAYLFSSKKLRLYQKGTLKWFFSMLVSYFMENNAYFWGYIAEDSRLLGVAIWEHPDEKAKVSLVSMLRTSGAVKLGPSRFKEMIDMLSDMEEMRKMDIRGIKCWMLHWIGVRPIASRQGVGRTLLENTIARHKEPLYVQVLDVEKGAYEFFKQCCFIKVRQFCTKVKYYANPIMALGMWQGMATPEELRIEAASRKKKTTLQLTYSTVKKKSSAALQLALTNGSAELARELNSYKKDPEYLQAKQKLEESKLLLENLKLSLSQMPVVAEGEEDELTLELRKRVEEQKVLVQVMQRAMNVLVPGQQKALPAAGHVPGRVQALPAPPLKRRSMSMGSMDLSLIQKELPSIPRRTAGKPLPLPPRPATPTPPATPTRPTDLATATPSAPIRPMPATPTPPATPTRPSSPSAPVAPTGRPEVRRQLKYSQGTARRKLLPLAPSASTTKALPPVPVATAAADGEGSDDEAPPDYAAVGDHPLVPGV